MLLSLLSHTQSVFFFAIKITYWLRCCNNSRFGLELLEPQRHYYRFIFFYFLFYHPIFPFHLPSLINLVVFSVVAFVGNFEENTILKMSYDFRYKHFQIKIYFFNIFFHFFSVCESV